MKPDLIIYPDASMKLSGQNFYSGYGTVILNPHNNSYTVLDGELSKKSVVYCEAWAIYQGLRYIEHLRRDLYPSDTTLKVLIVSDSKICVNTFTHWIKTSWDVSDWNNWKKADKTLVKNQEVYRGIMRILSNGHYQVKFVHINSHSNNNPKKIQEIKNNLNQAKVKLDKKTLEVFISMNALADTTARAVTTRSKELEDPFPKLEYIRKDVVE